MYTIVQYTTGMLSALGRLSDKTYMLELAVPQTRANRNEVLPQTSNTLKDHVPKEEKLVKENTRFDWKFEYSTRHTQLLL